MKEFVCIECGKTTTHWWPYSWVRLSVELGRQGYRKSIKKKTYWCMECADKLSIMSYDNRHENEMVRGSMLRRAIMVFQTKIIKEE